jgi:hypothetical protein
MYGRVQPCAHGVQRQMVRGDLDYSRGVRGQRQAQRPPAARMRTGQSGRGTADRLGKANHALAFAVTRYN